MKIGIMSMQRIRNYGSFLQGYALKKIIEEICGKYSAVEFIDYHIQKKEKPYSLAGRIVTRFFEGETLTILFSRKAFNKKFDAEYFKLLGLEEKRYQQSVQSDVLVIGSDEVFNCTQRFGFAPDLFGENGGKNKTISYAASFGYTNMDRLEKYDYKEKVAKMLKNNFGAISVRDKNSCEIVTQLIGKKPDIHLDPVLIYGFENKYVIPEIDIKEKYIIIYGYFGSFTKKECDEIQRYARKNDLKVYCILGRQRICDKYIIDDPFSILAYFKNAEAIITDTFHGTIFSIINRKPLVVILRTKSNGNENKLADLLQRLDLDYVKLDVCNKSNIEKALSFTPDYDNTERIIDSYRQSAKQYLKTQLEII